MPRRGPGSNQHQDKPPRRPSPPMISPARRRQLLRGATARPALDGDPRPEFRQNADLQGHDLADRNIAGAHLRYANLAGANLAGANLDDTNLVYANLPGANLQGATLTGANLTGANLNNCNLQGATLTGANLAGARLNNVTLDAATDLGQINLRDTFITNLNIAPHAQAHSNSIHAQLTNAGATIQ